MLLYWNVKELIFFLVDNFKHINIRVRTYIILQQILWQYFNLDFRIACQREWGDSVGRLRSEFFSTFSL